jgi:pyruvate dehydrogenase (quinone)
MVISGNPEFGVNLQPIDFAAYAKACGAAGYCIDDPTRCEEVLREAFAQPGPAVIEAVVDANEPPLPGRIKTQEAMRFAQALLKGQPDKWKIVSNAMKDVIGQKVREVV